MKIEKKLMRGLTDLSPLFSDLKEENREVVRTPIAPKHSFSIQKPEPEKIEDNGVAQLVCVSLFPAEDLLDVQYEGILLKALSATFEKICFLSVEPSYRRYEALSQSFPIPPWEWAARNESIRCYPLSGSTNFVYIPEAKFESIVELKPSLYPPEFSEQKKILTVFDSAVIEGKGPEVANFLDHGIFVTTASTEHLLRAYEMLRTCSARNRSMRFSILVVGEGAAEMSELVYERFSEIVSQFVGFDLGFLGWIEEGNTRINSDILLQEGGSIAQSTSKIRLSEALRLAEC